MCRGVCKRNTLILQTEKSWPDIGKIHNTRTKASTSEEGQEATFFFSAEIDFHVVHKV